MTDSTVASSSDEDGFLATAPVSSQARLLLAQHGLDLPHKILCCSAAELQKRVAPATVNAAALLRAAAVAVYARTPSTVQAMRLDTHSCRQRLDTGCAELDAALQGGFLLPGISEIVGESASGKSQLCLQLCLSVQRPLGLGGLEGEAVYIATEDKFPHRRLADMAQAWTQRHPATRHTASQLTDGVLVACVDTSDDLLDVVDRSLPALLSARPVRLIVIDSVAAVFRAEYNDGNSASTGGREQALKLNTLSRRLHRLCELFHVAIVIVNQVSDHFNDGSAATTRLEGPSRVIPALGLTWSNAIHARFLIARRHRHAADASAACDPSRVFSVVFAPHLPPSRIELRLDQSGFHPYC